MRVRHRVALATGAAVLASVAVAVIPAGQAAAHGTMSDPPSRVYVCRNEGPEAPKSAACKAAVAAAGTQAFYDWNEVSLLDAGGRHREIIPDGRLCSAGREKYRGLDLQRADWPARRISPGQLTITYHATAPHANSNFEFYITRQGWNPTLPLRWSDLVHLQTFDNQNPTTFTNWTLTIPKRSGRHILYSIWQRVVGSAEAFYTCSDVDFGGGTAQPDPRTAPPPNPRTATPPNPRTAPRTVPPTTGVPRTTAAPRAQPAGGTWAAGVTYPVGARVTYDGRGYRCRQAHTTLPGWEPPIVPALWLPI